MGETRAPPRVAATVRFFMGPGRRPTSYGGRGRPGTPGRPPAKRKQTPMTPFSVAHAATDDWARAAKACADGLGGVPVEANLGFVYVTDALAEDLGSILTYLRQRTGIEHWVGGVGMGICAESEEYFDRPAVAVMAANLPEDGFSVIPTISKGTDELSAGQRAWMKRVSPRFGIVHVDPGNPDTPGLIEDLALAISGFLVGGLTSPRATGQQVAERVTGGGLSGILFAPEVKVATGLSQGCTPIGASHVISDCVDNVLLGLDGRRALEVFKEDVGDLLAHDLNRVAGYIHVAIPIEGSDTGDYMVRNLVGIDPVRGWLAVGGEIHPGGRLMFVRRDPKSAEADLVAMLEKLKRRLAGPPKGGVYISCVARGANMFGKEGREMALIRAGLGAFPLVGFYAGGEISNNRLYAYTGVLVLFL